MRGVLVTGEKRVTIQIVHTYERVKVHAITICSRTSGSTLRARLTSRTIYVNPTPSTRDCLGVRGVVDTALISNTSTVRPKFKFLSRGDGFTRLYRRYGVACVKPSSGIVDTLKGGSITEGAVIRTNIPIVPKDGGPICAMRRNRGVTNRVNCPVVIGTTLNNKKGKVHITRAPSRFRTDFRATRGRTRVTFKSKAVCLRRFMRRPHRVRFRVLTSGCKGIIRLKRESYSVREGRRGVVRRSPSRTLAPRLERGVKRTTIGTTGTTRCAGTKAVRFLLRGDKTFCFVRVGAEVRMRRPMAR